MPDINRGVHFSDTDRLVRAAMSGLTSRQRTIANNVANVDTPNFKASEVRFEDVLRQAASRPSAIRSQAALDASAARTTAIQNTAARGDGNNVDIEREMSLLGETTLTYSALTQTMSTRLGILRSVITGGR
jgi:flagellar basal-body rod protein FlgB